MTEPTAAARAVLDLALARPPTLGPGRLVCLDGPTGSGKTTLSSAVADAGPGAVVVHLDDLYAGWTGLPQVPGQLRDLLGPLAEGRAGSYRRYDWHASRYAETVSVEPSSLLVVEGVGAGAAPTDLITVLAWVEAPQELRLRRGLERDGEAAEPYWRSWLVAEAALEAVHRSRDRADLLVDGTTGGWGLSPAGRRRR